MAATLIPGLHRGELHRLVLPEQRGAGGLIEEVRYGLGSTAVRGTLRLECGDWVLKVRDLLSLLDLLSSRELELRCVAARRPETRVAAAALGLETETAPPPVGRGLLERTAQASPGTTALMVHQGTLRSGDHLQCEGSLLLLGDVNPGGRISAGGHVLVWGCLLVALFVI
ncbi:MAG: septum site-determining protein MinC, partial [Cyanobium sp.]